MLNVGWRGFNSRPCSGLLRDYTFSVCCVQRDRLTRTGSRLVPLGGIRRPSLGQLDRQATFAIRLGRMSAKGRHGLSGRNVQAEAEVVAGWLVQHAAGLQELCTERQFAFRLIAVFNDENATPGLS